MRVALFVTCLVDAIRPEIGFSVIKLLEDAGCEVVVPESQTCCGQPAFSMGDSATARTLGGEGAPRVRGDSITWSFRAARAAGMYACITSSSSATIRT